MSSFLVFTSRGASDRAETSLLISGMALRLVLAYLAMATAFHVPAQHRFASRPAVHSAPQVLGSRGSSSSG